MSVMMHGGPGRQASMRTSPSPLSGLGDLKLLKSGDYGLVGTSVWVCLMLLQDTGFTRVHLSRIGRA